jgi:hypothetical protein
MGNCALVPIWGARMETLLVVVLASIIILFCWGSLKAKWKQSKKKEHFQRARSSHLPAAAAATDLVPRIEKLINRDTTLYIVSNDASYFEYGDSGKYWHDTLKDWLTEKSCTIHYVLCGNQPIPNGALSALVNASKNKFFVHCINARSTKIASASEMLASKYEFTHPTLVDNADRSARAMWIEGYHPVRSSLAFEVDFVGPGLNKSENARFESIKSEINRLIEFSAGSKALTNKPRQKDKRNITTKKLAA